MRSKLDLGFIFSRKTFELFEVRPVWTSPDPNDYQKISFAKFRYIKTQKVWNVLIPILMVASMDKLKQRDKLIEKNPRNMSLLKYV